MKASELRQIMEQAHKELEGKNQMAYDEIMKDAIKNAKQGKGSMYWYGHMSDVLKKRLESDQFVVKDEHDPREGSFYIISWLTKQGK